MKYVIALLMLTSTAYADCRWLGIHVEDSDKLQRVLQCLNDKGEYEDIPFVVEDNKTPARKKANKPRCGNPDTPKEERVWKC